MSLVDKNKDLFRLLMVTVCPRMGFVFVWWISHFTQSITMCSTAVKQLIKRNRHEYTAKSKRDGERERTENQLTRR